MKSDNSLDHGGKLLYALHYTDNTDGNAWPSALGVASELHKSMAANYSAYIWWYIRRSYGLITEGSAISKRGYAMAQYARFVRPDATRIGATAAPYSDVAVTTYKRTDNKILLASATDRWRGDAWTDRPFAAARDAGRICGPTGCRFVR